MLIFLCQAGESTITVYAPVGSQITASGGGESWSGSVPSGASSVSFKVHTIATWSLTCTSGSLYRETTKQITSFGQSESWTVSFAFIKVHTHPGATIRATKTGFDLGPYTADSSGNYDIPIPENAIDSTAWTVSAYNGSVTDTDSATTDSATAAPDAYPLWHVPIIVISNTWTFNGSTIDNTVVKIQSVTSSGKYTGWKAWFKASCIVKFTFLKDTVDVCAVGTGGRGGNSAHPDNVTDYGGGGGEGGSMDTKSAQTLSLNTDYTVTIGGACSFGSLVTGSQGANGGTPSGGGSSGTYRSGGNGASSVDAWDGVHYSGRGDGGGGRYAFGDSTGAFDNVVYCHGGQGGDVGYGGGGPGSSTGVYANPGAGGGGASMDPSGGPFNGKTGIVLMRKH